MTKERSVLGRGLASILGSNSDFTKKKTKNDITDSSTVVGNTHEILLSQISANPFQPRTKFDQEKLNELVISIEQLGIIQPITVRKMKENEFQLISGARRLRTYFS